jgi:hypothetical protein
VGVVRIVTPNVAGNRRDDGLATRMKACAGASG